MALQEINFIRPEEVFTPSTEKARVRYKGYNGTERDIELADNLEGDVSEVINDTFVPNADGNVAFTDSDNVSHELLTAQGLGKAQVIATTWSALKALRDGGNLVAGSLYRITDYVTTTAQENTQSAGHQFDIVLLALSANKLAEEGWAMMNDNIYDVTFSDGVTKKCYIYCTSVADNEWNIVDCETLLGISGAVEGDGEDFVLNEETKTAITIGLATDNLNQENLTYNYFQNSNLSAWKVWYCLDNDSARFAWADTTNGKGVIYRMIDEFCNDLPYDFKNIQFPISLTSGVYDGNSETSEYVYTFSSTFEDGACNDLSLSIDVNNVKVGNYMVNLVFSLPNNIFYQNGEESAFFQSLVFDNLSARNIVLGNAIYCSFGSADTCVITGVENYTNIGYNDGEITSLQSQKVYVNGVEVAVVQGE